MPTPTITADVLRRHFSSSADLGQLAIAEREYALHLRADVHLALQTLTEASTSSDLVSGIRARHVDGWEGMRFADLVHDDGEESAVMSPLEYEALDIGDDEPLRCPKVALWCTHQGSVPIAILFCQIRRYGEPSGVRVQVAAPPDGEGRSEADRIFESIAASVQSATSYRGKILSLEQGH